MGEPISCHWPLSAPKGFIEGLNQVMAANKKSLARYLVDTGRKLNLHKAFSLCPVSRGSNRQKR